MKSEQELYSLPTFGKKEGKNRFFRSGPLVRVNLEPLKGAMVNCDGGLCHLGPHLVTIHHNCRCACCGVCVGRHIIIHSVSP